MSADLVARGLAAAQARSANSAALVNAVRNYGFFPVPISRLAANDTPTITVGTALANSTINGANYISPAVLATDTRIKWLSGPTAVNGGSGSWIPRGAWYGTGRDTNYGSVEFSHTGTAFEIACMGGCNPRFFVDDVLAGTAATTPADGNYYYVKATFPASRNRRIRVEGLKLALRGVNVANQNELASAGRSYPLITVMGDSFVEGTGAATPFDNEAVAVVRGLGGNIALGGVGQTGVLNPGTGGRVIWTDANRLTDLTMAGVTDAAQGISTAPSLGVVMMSINDGNLAASLWSAYGANFQAAVNNRVWTLIDAWQAANPGKPLVFFGPTSSNGSPGPDNYRVRDATQQACAGAARSNVWFVDRYSPKAILRDGVASFISAAGNTTSGSATISGFASTAGIAFNAGIEGPGIPAGARVMTIAGTSITIDLPATATATAAALVFRNSHTDLYGFGPADLSHPGQAGHNYDVLWMTQQLRRLILTEFA
ncbi:MAG: hypothetical protein QFC78_05490 [Pseudomonadota bacterium]|nr:hypothetical protein [Pseudomonadota bacterium]